jgi:hypothetical protein
MQSHDTAWAILARGLSLAAKKFSYDFVTGAQLNKT